MTGHDDLGDSGHGQSYFVPLADLLTGLVFILIVILTGTMVTSRPDYGAEQELNRQHARIVAEINRLRQIEKTYIEPRHMAEEHFGALLARVQSVLATLGVRATVDREASTLRLPLADQFENGKAVLTPRGRQIYQTIAAELEAGAACLQRVGPAVQSADPCGAIGQARPQRMIIAVHGEQAPAPETGLSHAQALTAARAARIYGALTEARPSLVELKDAAGRAMLEFRGLGSRVPAPSAQEGPERLELILMPDAPPLANSAIGQRPGR